MIYDLIGIGYGPSNIGINICLREQMEESYMDYNFKFIEKKPSFDWHSGMLLPDTYLQVSFLKDLVTQRNPRSKYTFLNFLFETGRLSKFINLRQFEPTRKEFEEYLKWITCHFKDDVNYGYEIKSVSPIVKSDGSVHDLKVIAENKETEESKVFLTKNLSVAIGGTPNLPETNKINHRLIHSCSFLSNVDKIEDTEKRYRFAVVGAGQSAIEMLLYLHRNFPNAIIDSVFSNFAYNQSDSSLFVNEVFLNDNVDPFYNGNSYVKDEMFMKKTNYAVVDEKELEELYRIAYMGTFYNKKPINFLNFSKVESIHTSDNSVSLTITNLQVGEKIEHNYDYVFLGTGFKKNKLSLMEELKEYLFMGNDEYQVNRDYSLKTTSQFLPKIYVQGHSESQHGLTNTLLSVIPLRSNEITSKLMEEYYVKSQLIPQSK